MLLAGIPANSIHSLWELDHAYYAFQLAMDFFLAGYRATRCREGCSGLKRPLACIELERTHEQKKPYLTKRVSWRGHSQLLPER